MKTIQLTLALLLLFSLDLSAQQWLSVGPDSSSWRGVVQMDVSFKQGRIPFIGVGTKKGIAVNTNGNWRYPMPDLIGYFFPPENTWFRSIQFSPWNDSLGFIAGNLTYSFEPGSMGYAAPIIPGYNWSGGLTIGGGYVGFSPSLSFEFSPRHPGRVYSWLLYLHKSSNSGATWDWVPGPSSYGVYFLALDALRDSLLYAGRKLGGQDPSIFRSTDDGLTWTPVHRILVTSNPFLFQRPVDFLAMGDTLVYATNRFPNAADSTCGISVSTDYGATWTHTLPGINVQKLSRDPQRRHHIYAAAQGGIYRSVTSGRSWELIASSLPSLNLTDIRKDPYSDTLYIATSDSGVYKVIEFPVYLAPVVEKPVTFELMQNYPNPFNPTTTIKYQIPSSHNQLGFGVSGLRFVSLKVFDLLGREVATLINEVKEPGTYTVRWDARELASGTYFYRMTLGSFSNVKKLLLLR